MRNTIGWCVCLAVVLLGAGLGLSLAAPEKGPGDKPGGSEPDAGKYKPRWQVGQQWIVETLHTQVQARRDVKPGQRSDPVRWQFTVQGQEKVGGQNCYKVQVRCLAGGRVQPLTTLWVEERSMTLKQVQTQMPVQGSFRTVTESYQTPGGKPAPVLAPLTVLPLELPAFLEENKEGGGKEGGSKAIGSGRFGYEAVSGPGGVKAVGDVGFTFEVEQQTVLPAPEQVKGLLGEEFTKSLLGDEYTKSLERKPVLRVDLKAPGRKVTQLWQQDRPWPVYSSNGSTEARLIKVLPPKP